MPIKAESQKTYESDQIAQGILAAYRAAGFGLQAVSVDQQRRNTLLFFPAYKSDPEFALKEDRLRIYAAAIDRLQKTVAQELGKLAYFEQVRYSQSRNKLCYAFHVGHYDPETIETDAELQGLSFEHAEHRAQQLQQKHEETSKRLATRLRDMGVDAKEKMIGADETDEGPTAYVVEVALDEKLFKLVPGAHQTRAKDEPGTPPPYTAR